jgi:hypothetical protein
MISTSIESGTANSGRLPRLGFALRDPMQVRLWQGNVSMPMSQQKSRAERCLNRRSVKTIGILSVGNCSKFTPLLESPIRRASLQLICLSSFVLSHYLLLYSLTLFTHLKGTC